MEQGSSQPEQGSSQRNTIALAAVTVLVVAVAFYFIGRAVADPKGAEQRGFERGQESAAEGFRPGTPRYDRIYNRGVAAGKAAGRKEGERAGAERGRQVGFEQGEKVGTLQGDREGIQAGANAALGAFQDWETGVYYIVKLAPGELDISFRIDQREKVEPTMRYAICASDDSKICSHEIPGR